MARGWSSLRRVMIPPPDPATCFPGLPPARQPMDGSSAWAANSPSIPQPVAAPLHCCFSTAFCRPPDLPGFTSLQCPMQARPALHRQILPPGSPSLTGEVDQKPCSWFLKIIHSWTILTSIYCTSVTFTPVTLLIPLPFPLGLFSFQHFPSPISKPS